VVEKEDWFLKLCFKVSSDFDAYTKELDFKVTLLAPGF